VEECRSPAGVRELMILRVSQLLECAYQFDHHVPRARAAGVDDRAIEALAAWRQSDVHGPAERAALAVAEELTVDGRVAARTHEELAEHFAPDEIVELVLTASFYNCVCRVVGGLFDSEP
jgi:AhpD family alkylhydroperoxidase